MTILFNTNDTQNPNSYLTLCCRHAASELFGYDNVVLADNRTLLPLAAAGTHATLICLDGQRLNRGLLERARPAFRTMILWLFEDPFMAEYNRTHTDLFDHVFTNDPGCVGQYGGKGHYLPLAASPLLQMRPIRSDDELDYDIFFAGTMWPNRTKLLRVLLEQFPEKVFKLVCPTNSFLPPLPRDIAANAIQWPISHESFIDFANASRVTLTMFRDYASHGNIGAATAPGPRLFELGLAGTAQVMYVDPVTPRAAFDLVPGASCLQDLRTLVSDVAHLLSDTAHRRARAAAAQTAVVEKHLYAHRLRELARVTAADFTKQPCAATTHAAVPRRLRVLLCTHATIQDQVWGGVEVYQQTLVAALGGQIEAFYWLRRGSACTLARSDGVVLESFDAADIGWLDSLTDAPEEVAFSTTISQYRIDVVHFQHLGHHTASLPMIAKASGAGTVWSAHDFYPVCARYNLIDYNMKFCDIANRSITACDVCLRVAEGVPPGGQQVRRSFMAEALRSIDILLFGTRFSEDLFCRIYPALRHKRRETLGIPSPTDVPPSQRPPRATPAPLTIAILGNFLRIKGADVIMSLIETLDPRQFAFHLLGNPEPQYEEVFRNWRRANVTFHGRYEPGHLEILAACDVSLHLSLWPETFCISLSEAWQHGLVPIVTDIGALRDRVTHGETGFVVPVGDVAAVVDHLELLRAHPGMLVALRANITPALWTDRGTYVEALLDLYRAVAPAVPLGAAPPRLDVGAIHLLPHATWRHLEPPRNIFDPSRRADMSLDLPEGIATWIDINNSRIWIDQLSNNTSDDITNRRITASEQLSIGGWSYYPNTYLAGQVVVALIHDDAETTIFLPATRSPRPDIAKKFADAPGQAGFELRAKLQGKWANGGYGVAVINIFGEQAAFVLTSLRIEIDAGRIVDVAFRAIPRETIEKAFHQVAWRNDAVRQRPTPGLPPALPARSPDHSLRHVFDEIGGVLGIVPSVFPAGPTRLLSLIGWCVQEPCASSVGEVHVGLMAAGGWQPVASWRARRVRRVDVQAALGAPAMRDAGFMVDVEVTPAIPDGRWRLVLYNVADERTVIEATSVVVTVCNGHFTEFDIAEPGIAADAPAQAHAAIDRPQRHTVSTQIIPVSAPTEQPSVRRRPRVSSERKLRSPASLKG